MDLDSLGQSSCVERQEVFFKQGSYIDYAEVSYSQDSVNSLYIRVTSQD